MLLTKILKYENRKPDDPPTPHDFNINSSGFARRHSFQLCLTTKIYKPLLLVQKSVCFQQALAS